MSSGIPKGYTARPLSRDDRTAIARLFERLDRHLGETFVDWGSTIRWLIGLPYVDPERDGIAVLASDGSLGAAGFASRDPASVGAILRWHAAVDPDHLDAGLGAFLMRMCADVVAERSAHEGSFDVLTGCLAGDERAHALFARFGFEHVRTSWDMARPLARGDTASGAPDGVTIRTFETGRDERTLWDVAETSFEGHFAHVRSTYESWAAELYDDPTWHPDRASLAEVAGDVVGELMWTDSGTDGYIFSVGVLKEHRGRGIATALLRQGFADIATAGFERAILSVDSENATGAVGLYRKVGMEPIREDHIFRRRVG